MKTFSNFVKNINENCTTSDVNPGNGMGLGVTNHLTPVQNIVTNLRNLFTPVNGVVATIAEDGFSVKLHSSKFINKEETEKFLFAPVYQNQSLYSYIVAQGLDNMKMLNLGQYIVVYFGPKDIKAANPGQEPNTCATPCKEMLDLNIAEAEYIIKESDEDEELEQIAKANLRAIIASQDKVKAAKQFAILVGQQMKLPQDYYFAGVKSQDGDESIALRWKYIKRKPHNKSVEITHSLMNIFGDGEDAIWIGDFDNNAKFLLPEDVKELIESILELLGATKTDDPCVYKITDEIVDTNTEDDKKDDSSSETSDNEESDKKSSEEGDGTEKSSEETESDSLL